VVGDETALERGSPIRIALLTPPPTWGRQYSTGAPTNFQWLSNAIEVNQKLLGRTTFPIGLPVLEDDLWDLIGIWRANFIAWAREFETSICGGRLTR